MLPPNPCVQPRLTPAVPPVWGHFFFIEQLQDPLMNLEASDHVVRIYPSCLCNKLDT